MNFDLLSFATADELARAVAGAWLDEVAAANRAGKFHYVALSGGRITLKFFAAVIELSKAKDIRLAGVHFFWADERCVPPTDPESNFATANEHFFQPLGIEPTRIHRIQGELPPEAAAKKGETEMLNAVPKVIVRLDQYCSATGTPKSSAPENRPVLDLIFLGMGEDGHVASLFPGEPEAARANPAVFRAVTNSPKPPPNRVTLGYAAIAAAKQVWVLASGIGKEAALDESLSPTGQTPLARVLQSRAHSKVFTDIR